jgi:flagellar motor component MotA
MTKNRSFSGLVFVVIVGLGALATLAMYKVSFNPQSVVIMGCAIVLAFIISSAIQVADQWSKAVVQAVCAQRVKGASMSNASFAR